jgi:hypothetical protein
VLFSFGGFFMQVDDRTKRTIYHGAPRPDLPTQQHDLLAALQQLLSRLDALEAAVAELQEE